MLAHAARHARTARVTRVLVVMPQHEIEVMKKDAIRFLNWVRYSPQPARLRQHNDSPDRSMPTHRRATSTDKGVETCRRTWLER